MFSFFSKKQTDPKKMLKRILGDYSIPTFSENIMNALKTVRDPDSTSQNIAEALVLDPGLSVKVLQTVNSAAFATRKKIDNLNQATALMGRAAIESLILSIGTKNALPQESSPLFNPKSFWKVASQRASIGVALSEIIHPRYSMECFTGGFLQDMALPLLIRQKPDDYKEILEEWHQGEMDLDKIERSRFGWDHAEVATWICWEWNLPENLTSTIGGHHQSSEASDYDCPLPVKVVAHIREHPESLNRDYIVNTIRKEYDISEEKLLEAIECGLESAHEIAQSMN